MNKQEVIRKMHEAGLNCKAIKYASQFDKGYNNGIAYAINLLDKLDEPEKPTLTEEEAEWIEGLKEEQERRPFCTKYSMLYFITRCGFGYGFSYDHKGEEIELKHYPYDSHKERERLMNAWLYGYEVEKEKLYTVELPSPNCPTDDHYILSRLKNRKIIINRCCIAQWKKFGDCQLTEAEIKKNFDWAWQFAEEVEE